jgi:hypothetical protein
MANVKDDIIDGFVAHDIDLLRFSAGERREALKVLRQMQKDLLELVGRLEETASETVRMNRLKRMEVLVADIIRTSYKELRGLNRNATKGVAKIQDVKVKEIINGAIGVDIATLTVPATLLKSTTDAAIVIGAPAAEYWGRMAAATKNKFMDEMRLGVLAGENLGTLKRRIRGTRERNFKDGLLTEKRKGEAEALIRTSVQSTAQHARLEVLKQNQRVLRGWQASATLDEKTSDICIARSGGAWDFNGNPLPDSPVQEPSPGPPPWHFNCRTQVVSVLKDIEGIKKNLSATQKKRLRQLSRGTQQSIDGSVAGDLNFSQWLERQSEARQRRILGPGRLELWKSGDINLTQLIDQRGRPLTLNELRQR